MDTQALEELGLTSAEIKVYIALLGCGLVKAGVVLQNTGLPNSVVHLTLGKLVKKGLASFVKKGNLRLYQASEPQYLLRLLDERRRRFEALLPELIAKQATAERQEAEVFQGLNGLKVMLYKAIEGVPRGSEFLFFSFNSSDPHVQDEVFDFYKDYRRDRVRRGLIVKGIAPEAEKHRFEEWGIQNVIYVNYPTIQNVSVVQDRVIMTPWDEQRVSFLITSPQLAENFRGYFRLVWNQNAAAHGFGRKKTQSAAVP